jgi:hypothetical protein
MGHRFDRLVCLCLCVCVCQRRLVIRHIDPDGGDGEDI